MKKTILIIMIILAGFSVNAQYSIQKVTLYDTTRADGQRFIISYPEKNLVIHLQDSCLGTDYNPFNACAVPSGYISLQNSRVDVVMKKVRILAGDTLIRYETITIPLSQLENKTGQFIDNSLMKKALKPTAKGWIKRKLSEE